LIGAGIIAAAQIGKASIAVPLIRADFDIGHDAAGLMVGMFATLGAALGIFLGAAVAYVGVRRALVGGMAVVALGNGFGAIANDATALLVARFVEGIGFFGIMIAIPSLLAQTASGRAKDFAMAVWTAAIPSGIAFMLLAGPLLSASGWRSLWLVNAVVALTYCVLLARKTPFPKPKLSAAATTNFREGSLSVLRSPGCLVVALAFFAYSCQIFSLTFALPSLLIAEHNVTLESAGLLSAVVLTVSAAGHALCRESCSSAGYQSG